MVIVQQMWQNQLMAVNSSTDADTGEVAEFAGQLFFRLWRASHTRTADALAALGLTPALFAILNFLGHRGAAIQLEIANAMGIDPSALVSLIDELERAGLARRRPHPDDRRAREVTLTAKGRRSLEKARQAALDVEGQVLRGLEADERRELLRLLRTALDAAPPQSMWRTEEGD
jgi:MarR family transcriptional regulator, lower aerobic nicotinate degradation pathway regulator